MKDLTGHRFGRLTATRPTDQREGTNVIWECACDCGSITYVSSRKLGSGHTQSCGCLQKEKAAETAKEIVKKRTVDLTGQRFGRLLAVRATDQRKNNKVIWECKCDCGNTVYVKSALLKNGTTSSCGCLFRERWAESAKKRISDLTGQRFGRLLVVRATDQRNNNKVVWECKCDCGNTVYIKSTLLKNGTTKSCGCLRKETMVRNRQQAERPHPQNPCNDDKHENE